MYFQNDERPKFPFFYFFFFTSSPAREGGETTIRECMYTFTTHCCSQKGKKG